MNYKLFYGQSERSFPWYDGLQVSANGSMDVSLIGVDIFEINEENQNIRWYDLFYSKLETLVSREEVYEAHYRHPNRDLEVYGSFAHRLWDQLVSYCNPKAKTEKDFFNLYCDLCRGDFHEGAFLPALIPHVYLNWNVSKKDEDIPCIADFVFKNSAFGTNNLVVVEIDGSSHYTKYNSISGVNVASEEIYANHLKKDRWLRKQGFKVFRIGNAEINKIMALPEKERFSCFYHFFRDVFGDVVYIEENDEDCQYFI